LIYEDLKKDSHHFINKIATLLNSEIKINEINTKKKHASYNTKQLKTIIFFSKILNLKKRRVFTNIIFHFIWRILMGSIRYSILYISYLIPDLFYNKKPLVTDIKLNEIKEYFKNDWNKCLDYSKKINVI